MNEMLDKIQTNYEQLARFSEDIAHELRTPLNNLIGQTQIALSQSRFAKICSIRI
ncbi:histidine kinase dimerization/phospho-acceptor domain-containing protein [Serratia proteamaculans]